jgi:hypothetical protein
MRGRRGSSSHFIGEGGRGEGDGCFMAAIDGVHQRREVTAALKFLERRGGTVARRGRGLGFWRVAVLLGG